MEKEMMSLTDHEIQFPSPSTTISSNNLSKCISHNDKFDKLTTSLEKQIEFNKNNKQFNKKCESLQTIETGKTNRNCEYFSKRKSCDYFNNNKESVENCLRNNNETGTNCLENNNESGDTCYKNNNKKNICEYLKNKDKNINISEEEILSKLNIKQCCDSPMEYSIIHQFENIIGNNNQKEINEHGIYFKNENIDKIDCNDVSNEVFNCEIYHETNNGIEICKQNGKMENDFDKFGLCDDNNNDVKSFGKNKNDYLHDCINGANNNTEETTSKTCNEDEDDIKLYQDEIEKCNIDKSNGMIEDNKCCIQKSLKKVLNITDLNDLIAELHAIFQDDRVNTDYVQHVMKSYKSNLSEWRKYAKFDQFKYTRNLVDAGNDKFNLMILCWGEGHGSSIHDHADAHCFMKMLDGGLTETRYAWPEKNNDNNEEEIKDAPLKVISKSKLMLNDVCYINDSLGLHRVENSSYSDRAVSLHLYSPPFSACSVFNERTGHKTISKVTFWSKFGKRDKSLKAEDIVPEDN